MSVWLNKNTEVGVRIALPEDQVAVTIMREQEDRTFRLGKGLSCQVVFDTYGEMRTFFLKATAEILGVPDPHNLPNATLSRNHLMTAFAKSILKKWDKGAE